MSVDERRAQFRWMDKLSDEDVTAVSLAQPGTEPGGSRRIRRCDQSQAGSRDLAGGRARAGGGVYIVKSASPPELWDRIGEAIR